MELQIPGFLQALDSKGIGFGLFWFRVRGLGFTVESLGLGRKVWLPTACLPWMIVMVYDDEYYDYCCAVIVFTAMTVFRE